MGDDDDDGGGGGGGGDGGGDRDDRGNDRGNCIADGSTDPAPDGAVAVADVMDAPGGDARGGLHTEDLEARLGQKPRFHRRLNRKRELADGFKKNKVVNEVLDKPTVMTLYKMIIDGVLSGVNGSVSAGKESLVFWGLDAAGADVAVKIYLVSTSNFKRRQKYILGDPRFASVRRGTRNTVYLWARKEFRNLAQCAKAGIPVPRPIHVANNVLAMEFVGDCDSRGGGSQGRPARQLLHSRVDRHDYLQAISILTNIYTKANLVHGDYSEYNIFKAPNRGLVVFDLGSAVDRRHPNSDELLQRDINNITRFFKKRGVEVDDAGHIFGDLIS